MIENFRESCHKDLSPSSPFVLHEKELANGSGEMDTHDDAPAFFFPIPGHIPLWIPVKCLLS